MSLHLEIEFEKAICHDLVQQGWLYAEGNKVTGRMDVRDWQAPEVAA